MREKRNILNIVNFIRAIEPREKIDLPKPVHEQIRLMQKHHLRGTFLLQYDSLLLPEYTDLLRSLDPEQFEIGIWHEVVQPMTEKAGIPWRGRWAWDWHPNCGYPIGYSCTEREKLADVFFAEFKRVMGYYPRVFGAWLPDTHTVRYVSERYGLDAVCFCKEQFGTDGYTLWGGYYGQGYYPSRNNFFMPAQEKDLQMDVPVFRMLGSDPIYQYDFGLRLEEGAEPIQGVCTLEPVYAAADGKNGIGGGCRKWVDWYLKENYNGECLSFSYAQAGQENSFGWERMRDGLTYQFARFAEMRDAGQLLVEPLGETGHRFKEDYAETPASAITAHGAFDDPEKSSVWYCSKRYRVNLYCDHGRLRVRDLHVFDDSMPDPFAESVCEGNYAEYETLPVTDGNRHSGHGVLSGVYLLDEDGSELTADGLAFAETAADTAEVKAGRLCFFLREDGFSVTSEKAFRLESRRAPDCGHMPKLVSADARKLCLSYKDRRYALTLRKGRFVSPESIVSEDGCVDVVITAAE